MAPYLDTVTVCLSSSTRAYLTVLPPYQSFADVPITEAGIDTLAFLKASEGLVGLFGVSPFVSPSPLASNKHPLETSLVPPHLPSSSLT